MSKQKVIIATSNSYKVQKLVSIVDGLFEPVLLEGIISVRERGDTFLTIAENKAIDYSLKFKSLAISTDGGAVIPALVSWNPLRTKRFAKTDRDRITRLLELMKDKDNRVVEWHEAIALANNGRLLFSSQARAMDGVIAKKFDEKFYKEGIWLCSVTEFPQFCNKNFFELNQDEKKEVENSWQKLQNHFHRFMNEHIERYL